MRTRFLARTVATATAAALGGIGLAAVTAAPASAATPAKPYDFNGDGYVDLAVGSPHGKVSGRNGAGFVTVTYGRSSGLNTGKRQVIHQNTTGVGGTAESGDHFGYAVASADFDSDGYADLAVSAPDEDSGSATNIGALTIFWGMSSGLSTYATTDAFESGLPNGARAGTSLTAGNFNGFENADLGYTGAAGWGWLAFDPGLYSQSAKATRIGGKRGFVHNRLPVPGKRADVRAAAAPAVQAKVRSGYSVTKAHPDLVLTWYDPAAPAGEQNWVVLTQPTQEGQALGARTSIQTPAAGGAAVGDFDGDGYGDLAVGRPGDAGHTGGEIGLYKGTATGFETTGTVLSAATAGVPGTPATGDRFGADLSAADVNKDGRADLAIGAPGVKVGSATTAGGLYLLLGSASGITGSGAQWLSQDTEGVPGGAEKNDKFGYQVALLDLTRDGYSDLVVGGPGENADEGSITVLRGRSTGVRPVTGAVAYGPGTWKVYGIGATLGLTVGD